MPGLLHLNTSALSSTNSLNSCNSPSSNIPITRSQQSQPQSHTSTTTTTQNGKLSSSTSPTSSSPPTQTLSNSQQSLSTSQQSLSASTPLASSLEKFISVLDKCGHLGNTKVPPTRFFEVPRPILSTIVPSLSEHQEQRPLLRKFITAPPVPLSPTSPSSTSPALTFSYAEVLSGNNGNFEIGKVEGSGKQFENESVVEAVDVAAGHGRQRTLSTITSSSVYSLESNVIVPDHMSAGQILPPRSQDTTLDVSAFSPSSSVDTSSLVYFREVDEYDQEKSNEKKSRAPDVLRKTSTAKQEESEHEGSGSSDEEDESEDDSEGGEDTCPACRFSCTCCTHECSSSPSKSSTTQPSPRDKGVSLQQPQTPQKNDTEPFPKFDQRKADHTLTHIRSSTPLQRYSMPVRSRSESALTDPLTLLGFQRSLRQNGFSTTPASSTSSSSSSANTSATTTPRMSYTEALVSESPAEGEKNGNDGKNAKVKQDAYDPFQRFSAISRGLNELRTNAEREGTEIDMKMAVEDENEAAKSARRWGKSSWNDFKEDGDREKESRWKSSEYWSRNLESVQINGC